MGIERVETNTTRRKAAQEDLGALEDARGNVRTVQWGRCTFTDWRKCQAQIPVWNRGALEVKKWIHSEVLFWRLAVP